MGSDGDGDGDVQGSNFCLAARVAIVADIVIACLLFFYCHFAKLKRRIGGRKRKEGDIKEKELLGRSIGFAVGT